MHAYYKSFISVADEATIIHSYRTVITGFAAKLSLHELSEMSIKKGFISARPVRTLSMHTTHSPHFLGLNPSMGLWRDSNYGRGVIIGLIESGISPDHPSFSDEGVPPPPAKWKGMCEFTNHSDKCNNKIIGARSFGVENQKEGPADKRGHGTHASSTAAGNFVKGVSFFGNAYGTASGIAPLAHLAIYQVCAVTCEDSDLLAGMDAAIDDGVDVLSISISIPFVGNFYNDTIAIGAFRAMEKGIFVSCSAGNGGPYNFSTSNEAPWVLTVGASTTDRELRATAVLGNNQRFQGQAALQPKCFARRFMPLVYTPDCRSADSLNGTHLKGKVVVCKDRGASDTALKSAGAAAMILVNEKLIANTTVSEAKVLPVVNVGYADGLKIKDYINSTTGPKTKILFGGTVIGDERAPVVAGFSSRGPCSTSPGILKPDIIGPGVNILAAWPTSVEHTSAKPKSAFNMISGTSMACPHLSGVAALLKSTHPDWTPAANKSAIMTTADVVNLAHNLIEDETFLPAGVFDIGSGHVNPSAANNPGLIYDIQPEDYIPYLCGLNYTNQQVGMILNKKVDCSEVSGIRDSQLNYPAFVLTFIDEPINSSQTYTRTVTNVGKARSCYKVTVASPPGFDVRVSPKTLSFSKLNQKRQYQVTFKRLVSASDDRTYVEGFLKWRHATHSVRSPIAMILQADTS